MATRCSVRSGAQAALLLMRRSHGFVASNLLNAASHIAMTASQYAYYEDGVRLSTLGTKGYLLLSGLVAKQRISVVDRGPQYWLQLVMLKEAPDDVMRSPCVLNQNTAGALVSSALRASPNECGR